LLQSLLTAMPDEVARFRASCEQVGSWQTLFDHAELHGVAGLLHRALRQADYVLPAAEGAAIDRRVAAGRLMQIRRDQGMRLVLAALAKAGLPTVALKGPLLAERLYGDSALRFAHDLDILVSPGDFDSASAVLESLGFQQPIWPTARYDRDHTHNVTFYGGGLPPVELHFHLLVEFGVTVPADAFLSRAVRYRAQDGTDCGALSAEDEAFYLCLHAAHHGFARYCWVHDIWTFLQNQPDLDWDKVFLRAEECRVREPIFYAVELLRRRLGLTCGTPLRPLRRRGRQALASLMLRLSDRFTPGGSSSTMVNLFFKAALCDRLSDSAHFLAHNFWRATRRRIQRWAPRLAPEEWSA
jgi:hypothetical protein